MSQLSDGLSLRATSHGIHHVEKDKAGKCHCPLSMRQNVVVQLSSEYI